jgi:hypothetical protein
MTRTWLTAFGLLVSGLLIAGCDAANNAAKKTEEGAKKAAGQAKEAAKEGVKEMKEVAKEAGEKTKEMAKDAVEAAKSTVLKPIMDAMPKLEEKLKGLSGESATKAKEAFEQFKKKLEEFKSAAPDKWEALKEGLLKEFAELKKLLGMEK